MRLILLAAALLAASAAVAADRTVTDDTGRSVAMPDDPKRIVVLHEPAIGVPIADLGLSPVGSYGRADNGDSLMAADFYRAVLGDEAPEPLPKGIGPIGNIDLERLRALDPDLIIGTEHDVNKVERLSTIAPVYLQNSSTGLVSGFDSEEALANLLNRRERFVARRADYLGKVEEIRSALSEDPRGKTYLAIFLTDQINAVGQLSGAVQALEDLGYQRMELEQAGAIAGYGSTLLVPLSAEIFGRLDPDLLVVMNTFGETKRGEAAARAALDRIVPGWERFLKPAREERILFLDSAKVTTPSIASALHTLEAFREWATR